METNTSKFNVLIGEEIGSNEQSSFNLNIQASKDKANSTIEEVQALIGDSSVNVAQTATFIFPCSSANVDRLAELVEKLFTDPDCCEPAKKSFVKFAQEGIISYNVIKGEERVLLVVNPGETVQPKIQGQIQMAAMFGGALLQQATEIDLTLKSLNTFNDIEQGMQDGHSFLATILKSLQATLQLNVPSDLIDKALTIVGGFQPGLAESPIQLLRTFISLGFDLQFKSSDNLPDQVKGKLEGAKGLKKGLALPE
eukprot:CAMPEP_0114589396 /NCGR_PEP_ID=MMETSP0125-20121206/11847_1 /TAXON_ID=485358 ORGANISM="Aristerostoma sp., Strain ATCC 50986" /NCGR_SAMPLE_ID=MMETSP0125 /ASSEMBLY_ACC=CAM_ASM_000245 /LENGTH=253 /DNA_ID=CAMNT_0001786247 /DNA_START=87 /DNA_END=848 /DNA_ORIENTATION=+